jgi:hypothetical protein
MQHLMLLRKKILIVFAMQTAVQLSVHAAEIWAIAAPESLPDTELMSGNGRLFRK